MKTIVALDFKSVDEVKNFLIKFQNEKLQNYAKENNLEYEKPYFKVGMWLYYTAGDEILKYLQEYKIFLDLKLIDIPNTIYNASLSLMQKNIDILSIHSFAGLNSLKAARKAKEELNSKCELFGISILTSLNEDDLKNDLMLKTNMQESVKQRINILNKANFDGVVCSAYEAHLLKDTKLKALCPGIRFKNQESNDQERVASPKFAKENNIDYIVAGRMITNSKDPIRAYFNCIKGEEYE
ncbi:orotidine-5'-phosphate decarboxylase [Campylobacter canadensis]|uniref:Orotidine 5'-phosphate decarboxylase n=1 Tax=Campylobacter canadensis TaxID=449520 RepID=A0ABS7WTL5_9BACT|nr:orotidine-5'-phosphate decarboxylase [Campylobacter canadensis]MBZ7988121.1 orotidine-5'-phosphate decarboxylase [Campylobacter canadensis]MBZ7995579.1 orotidine-5'-phosphate decarboxylase [Campylobacter canadensis]MBZ7997256.1 orotidine-5'-phosphate decarboxylase [Campylobacter canadensis]MBZ7999111.1 orotidine-5'-phosphate decarboxylase [Campylobacter canadensis]MBZ8000910.1 orotidine-5'-phosphate decarboxylase [Campylobacter canadensis]